MDASLHGKLVACSLENRSLLEKLPRELISKLIEYAPEIVHNLRQTSRMLRSHVDDFARSRLTIPLCRELGIKQTDRYDNSGALTITMGVPFDNTNLYELRLKLNQPSLAKRINVEACLFGITCYVLRFESLKEAESLWETLIDCIGNSIGRLDVDPLKAWMLADVRKIIDKIQYKSINWVAREYY